MRPFRAPFVHKLLLLAASLLACACNLDNLGDPPPEADIYLPTGLAISAQTLDSPPRYLYVVNSNYDLRYNGGSIQAFDLERLNEAVGRCREPDASCVIPTRDILADEVLVSSLATSLGISPDHKRLYVATRTDTRLMFVDLDEEAERDEDVLKCAESERRCGANYSRGNDAVASEKRLRIPAEPVGLVSFPAASVYAQPDAALDGMRFVLIAHRSGQVSLFFDDGTNRPETGKNAGGPQLIDVRAGLSLEPTGITFDPMSRLAYLSVFARTVIPPRPNKVLIRIGLSPEVDPSQVFAYDAGDLNIDGTSLQRDTRAVTMNPALPGQALVLSYTPPALVWTDVAGSLNGSFPANSGPVRNSLPLGMGPSRIALGQLGSRSIAAVSCFDSHEVFIVDVARAELLTVIHNINGPFELAIDSARKRLYVADFRSSVVRVMDLGYVAEPGVGNRTDVPVIATLGSPKVVQELQ